MGGRQIPIDTSPWFEDRTSIYAGDLDKVVSAIRDAIWDDLISHTDARMYVRAAFKQALNIR